MIARALFVGILLTVSTLALAYGLHGWWIAALVILIVGALWLLAQRLGWSWVAHVALVLFVSAAAFGLGQDLPTGWMLFGLVAALSAWDLDHFAHRLDGAERVQRARLLGRRHLRRLLIVDGLGLLLGGAALTIQVQLDFGLILLLGLLALLGLSRAVRFLRREGG